MHSGWYGGDGGDGGGDGGDGGGGGDDGGGYELYRKLRSFSIL